MRVCNESKVCVTKWVDNKTECLASTFCEVEPLGTVKRIQPKINVTSTNTSQPVGQGGRSKIDVQCPDIVKRYNAFMGGVDLLTCL